MTFIDELKKLGVNLDDPGAAVPVRDLLPLADRLVSVEIDPSLHSGPPQTQGQRIVHETLDTAWNLMRVGVTRHILNTIRETVQDSGDGGEFPADAELQANLVGLFGPGATFAELAVDDPIAGRALELSWNRLLEVTSECAREALTGLDGGLR